MKEDKELKCYCYVCGKRKLKGEFALWSLSEEVDRVFIVCSDRCIKRMQDRPFLLKIKKIL